MKNSKMESLMKLVAFDFHLVAVLVVLFVFSVGAQAIARGVALESTDPYYVNGELK